MTDTRNPHEIALEFVTAMEAAGVKPSEPIIHSLLAGDLVRFHVDGDRPGRRNGWARLYVDGRPAGAFGCNRRQISEKWRAHQEPRTFSKADRAEYARRMQAQREERAASKRQAEVEASEKARSMLEKSQPATNHPYLVNKRIFGAGMRQLGSLLIVPMHDAEGTVWNIQCIGPDGAKRFLTGGRTSGLMASLNEGTNTVLIGEGAGTAAAVHRATGLTSYTAFSAGNVAAVAEVARSTWPSARLVICADDDRHLVNNPTVRRNVGLEEATAAALAVRGFVAIPPRPFDLCAQQGWDFGDVSDDSAIRKAIAEARPAWSSNRRNSPFGSLQTRMSRSRAW